MKEGKLAGKAGYKLPLVVCKSRAGYYVGTKLQGSPISRESVEYYQTAENAQAALTTNSWTQRPHP